MKKALITGITGQDGAYLSRLLFKTLNYEVHGLVRRNSAPNLWRLKKLNMDKNIIIHDGDLTEYESLWRIVEKIKPDEIYNLGAMSFVQSSFEIPIYTTNVIAVGILNLLEAVRHVMLSDSSYKPRIYQASSSEMFGKVRETPQTEMTRFHPRSPYGTAKAFAHHTCINYREAYDMFISCGILFNHESPLRGEEFVTRKITKNLAVISRLLREKKYDQQKHVLKLGNVEAERDWGHAEDYVDAMWLMLQQDKADDFVIATGLTTRVRNFLQLVLEKMKWDVSFNGFGKDFSVQDNKTGHLIVQTSEEFFRPSEVDMLLGISIKAQSHLQWKRKHTLHTLAQEMVDWDVKEFG